MKVAMKLLMAVVFAGGLVPMVSTAAILVVGGPYAGVDVGEVDTLLGTTNALDNSNPTTETQWVNSILAPEEDDPAPEEDDPTVSFQIKDEPVEYFATNESGVFAFYMAPPPSSYFLVKNATFWALYENLMKVEWGVFDTASLPEDMNLPDSENEFKISHVTRFDGGDPSVPPSNNIPEPATLATFGIGLLGLAAAIRRRKLI